MSCSTGTEDCHWERSGIYVTLHGGSRSVLIELEWCPRCGLLRVPEIRTGSGTARGG